MRTQAWSRVCESVRVVACAVLLTAAASAAWGQDLAEDVQRLLSRSRLSGASVGVSIVDLQSGQTLARVRDQQGFIPASNMKLLTSGVALLVLGADFSFTTEFWRVGDKLVILGDGDPGLGDPELLRAMGKSPGDLADWIVEQIRAGQEGSAGAGAAASSGSPSPIREIVVDDRVFDRETVHPSWPADQLGRWYCAPVSGLNFHANVIQVFVSPGAQEGEPANVRFEPATPWVSVTNRSRTVRTDTTAVSVDRQGYENRFVVSGSVRGTLDEPLEATTVDPGLILARMVGDRLASPAGGGVSGGQRPEVRFARPDEDLGIDRSLQPVARIRTRMPQVLERCNSDSHNMYAEALLKRAAHEATGQPGSWSEGATVARLRIRDLVGPEAAASVTIADGSGMSRLNRVSPGLLTDWLAELQKDPSIGPAFVESLAVAKQDGTLARRFRDKRLDNEVRAKSGFINGVRTLSGYVTNLDSGRRVAFSVLINEVPGNQGREAKQLHEDIVALIDRWLTQRQRQGRVNVGG